MTSTGTPDTPGPVPPGVPDGQSPAGHEQGTPSTDAPPAGAWHGGPHSGAGTHGTGTHGTSTGSHGAGTGTGAHAGTHGDAPHGPPHAGAPYSGTPYDSPQGGPTWGSGPDRPSSTAGFFASMRRTGIWRGQDRWIGGVAAGVARRLDVDPLLVRGILVVLSFFGGLGLLLYGIGWALLPEESDGRIHLQEALRGNVDAALAGAVIFVIIGLARPGTWWGGYGFWGDGWFLISLAFVALVIVGIVALARRGSSPAPSAAPPHGGWSGPIGSTPPRSGQETPTTAFAQETPTTAFGQAAYAPIPPADTPQTAYGQASYGQAAYGPTPTADAPQTAYGQAAYAPTPGAGAPPASGPVPWSAATTGAGRTGAPPREPYGQAREAYPPPVPPRPKSPGPGSVLVAVILALALLATAGLLLWDRVDPLGWMLPLIIGGAVLALLGLGVMIAGARGRRGGALSVLGVLIALLVVPGTSATQLSPVAAGFSPGAAFGDRTVAPTTPERAAEGYELLAGDLDIDLSQLELAGEPVTIPVSFGAGDLRILLPADAAVRLEIELGAGQIEGRTSPGWSGPIDDETPSSFGPAVWQQGSAIDATFTSPAAQEDGADIVLVVTAGAGDITIEEQ